MKTKRKQIHIYLSDEELKLIDLAAEEMVIPRATYMRYNIVQVAKASALDREEKRGQTSSE